MVPGWMATVAAGAAVGAVAAVPQAAVGKLEDVLFLPPQENSNFAPRLVHRLALLAGFDAPEPMKWSLGTGFHFGYGAAWGAGYALVREEVPRVPWLVGGLAMGGLIYAITFPRWGIAVQTGTERPPGRRTRRMTLVAASVAVTFGLSAAFLYDRVTGRA